MTDKVYLSQVVITELTRRGKGIEGDPIRIIRQVWSVDGNLLAEWDPILNVTDEEKYKH